MEQSGMQLATARAFSIVGGEEREKDGEGRDGERKSESQSAGEGRGNGGIPGALSTDFSLIQHPSYGAVGSSCS